MTAKRLARAIAGIVTLGFVLGVALPLLAERLLVDQNIGFKTQFLSFQLKDEDGRRHMGFLAAGHAFKDLLMLEYGFQPPEGKDLKAWQQPIIGLPRKDVKETEGFIWTDKGYLWGDFKTFGDSPYQEASRQKLDHKVEPNDQLELILPGAPWDVQAKELSFLGKYPDYKFNFEDKNFKFDLLLKAATPGWYQYNNGVPFRAGDFGTGSMDELSGNITGTIVHKQTRQTFEVNGTGLMEGAVGIPWSWIDWGAHDWNDFHFPGGWTGSLWKAQDDWQFGYHADPHLGWLWDPEQKKFLTFYRTEIVDVEYVVDRVSKLEYPKHATWRAIGPDGTFELRNVNLSFKPRESRFPIVGPFEFGLGMSYGNNISTARLIRRDGSTVELKDGIGTMEHFNRVIPDYVFWGPMSLVLLVLSWGFYGVTARRYSQQSIALPLAWSIVGLIGVWCLNLAWSI